MGSKKKKNRGGKGVETPPVTLPIPIIHKSFDDSVKEMERVMEERGIRPQEVVEQTTIGVVTDKTLADVLNGKSLEEASVSIPVVVLNPDAPDPPPIVLPPNEKIQDNISEREKAEDTLQMIEMEFGEPGNRFWEILRDAAIQRVGIPMKEEIKELEPFDDKRSEVFMKQAFPRGKYAERTVLSVEKKEGLAYLERFATKQDYFQRGLSRYIAWRKKHPLKKAKRKKKK